jgi:hypothetical protein
VRLPKTFIALEEIKILTKRDILIEYVKISFANEKKTS